MWWIWYRRTKWYTLVFGFIVLSAMAILLGSPKIFHKIWKDDNIPKESVRLMNTILHYHEKPEAEKRIPKIIHQIWDDEYIPEVFVENMKGLVVHNKPPEWRYMFWTHDNGQKLIENEYPRLLKLFLNSIKIMRSNLIRLVVIHHYGGVYFDLDTVSVKPLDPFVETHNCSFVTDPDEHVFYPNQSTKMLLITNSALFCGPGHWFIKDIIEKLYHQPLSCKESQHCSGPFFISKHYEILQRTNMSRHLPPIVDYRLFEDMVDPGRHKALEESCIEPFTNIKYEWVREVCRNWIKRGREKKISVN